MKPTLFLLLFLTVNAIALPAQTKPVKGHATDRENRLLDRATIHASGTKITVITNSEGAFSTTVPASATALVISSVGYNAVQKAIEGDDIIVILIKAG